MDQLTPSPVYLLLKRLVDEMEQAARRNVTGVSAIVQGVVAKEVNITGLDMARDAEYYELSTPLIPEVFVLGMLGFEEDADWELG